MCQSGGRACFNYPDHEGYVTVTGQNMEPLRLRKYEWWTIVETVRKKTGKPIPIWNCVVNYYNVCLSSLVTPLSRTLWFLYGRINGTQNETYKSYGELPAFWVDACDIIDAEIARINKVRNDKEMRKQEAILRRLGRVKHGHK